MRRREFIAALGSAAVAWPLGAQSVRPYRLAIDVLDYDLTLDLPDTACTRVQRRQFGLPARWIGRDLHDAVVDDVSIHHAAPAAIVAASAGDDGLARPIGATWRLIDRLVRHGARLTTIAPKITLS